MTGISQKWDLYFLARRNSDALIHIRNRRLNNLVDYAKNHSPFYRNLLRHISLPVDDLTSLPILRKPDLTAHFDAWVTDPAVTLQGVRDFLDKQIQPGLLYLNRFNVWTTSGTTGDPGIFLHDMHAQSIYYDLVLFRAYPSWLTLRQVAALLRLGFRYTLIIATGGPFAGISNWEQIRHRLGRYAHVLSTLSIDDPLPELVQKLNALQPAVVASYPSVLVMLAEEQARGALRIHPEMLTCTSEWLAPAARNTIEKAFAPARLVELYGASEFPYIATSCRHNWLHINADWAILEPIDRDGQPVAPGQPSHSVLLTNLANRIQPILRYDLGDSITLRPDPCPCGSRLPALRVEGRKDEILTFYNEDKSAVKLLPLAVASQVELSPGVQRYQILQTAADTLQVRLEVVPGSDPSQVWASVKSALTAFLTQQGLPKISLQLSEQLPHPDPVSGKFRQVWSEIKDPPG